MEELDDLSSIAGLALSPHTPLHKPAQSPSVGTGDSGAREGGEGAGEPRDIYFGLRIDEALALDSEMEEVGVTDGHASLPVASLLDCARVDWSWASFSFPPSRGAALGFSLLPARFPSTNTPRLCRLPTQA